MTQLLSLFNHVFGNQSKNKDFKLLNKNQSYISDIQKNLRAIAEAWIEARSEQAKYYNKHSHIE